MEDEWEYTPAEAPVSTGEDIARSSAGQGALGFGDIVGLPGFIGQGLQAGVKGAARMGMNAANYFGADIPVDQVMADVERGTLETLSTDDRKAVEEGKAIPSAEMGTLPTPYGVEAAAKEYLPFTQYEPKTTAGKISGAASRFATGSTLGPARTLPVRVVEGALAGVGSEAAGEYAIENLPEYETAARFVGAMGAPMAAKAATSPLKPFVMPGQFTDKTVAKLLAEDIRAGKSAMTPQQINEAISNGAMPSIIDMAGPRTREWISQRYGVSPASLDEVTQLNDMLAGRAEQARSNVHGFIEEVFPGLSSMSLEDHMRAAQEVERKNLYDIARATPAASNVWTSGLQTLTTNGFIRDAMKSVNDDFRNSRIPSTWGVNPPAPGMAPNLQYWDTVKKRIDSIINSSKPNRLTGGGDEATYQAATEAKKALVKELDAAVPEYAAARDSHSELIGYTSAPEAGAAFAKMTDSAKIRDVLRAYNKYNPEQQELFRRGVVRSLYDQLGSPSGSINGFIKRMTSERAQAYLPRILGDAEYDALLGRATAENVMEKAKLISQAQNPATQFALREVGKSAAWLGMGQVANLITHGDISALTPPAIASALAAGATLGKDLAFNYAERRIAPQVISLMRSTHPDDFARLGRLIRENPDAGSFMSKVGGAFDTAPMRLLQSQQTTESTSPDNWEFTPAPENYDAIPAQNTGGRVNRKSGGRIKSNPISAEVKRIRALLSHKTASMLSLPDDAVATALKIAKGH